MVTRVCNKVETARQLATKESSLTREDCVRQSEKEWTEDFINLYNSADEYDNRDNAIIGKLCELRDERSAKELKFLLDRVSDDERKEFVKRFFGHGVPCTKILVKWVGYTDLKLRNSGRIRLYLSKEGQEKMVYFERSATTIVFLICLLDVYNAEVGPLDFTKRDKQFRKLFKKVFAYDGGMDCFNTLVGKGNTKQKTLRHSLLDIRNTFASTCSTLHEDASPFVLNNSQSRLSILKKNIVIDEKLLNME